MTKKTPRREPIIPPGPFSTAVVATTAGVPQPTVRSWTDPARGWRDPREMWPSRYGKTSEQRLQAALKVRAQLEAAGEDVAWIDETLARMKQPSGPRHYSDVELLQVCALAELTRNGISPARARGDGDADTYLLDALTRELAVRAYIVPSVGKGAPLGPNFRVAEGGAKERYLVAERRNSNASLSIQTLTPGELQAYFTDPARSASTMWTVIDCDALLQRIVERLDEVTRGEKRTEDEP